MKTRIEHVRLDELHPTYQTLAKVIGLEAAVKLGQEFAKETIYFPALQALTNSRREERDRKILEDIESGEYTEEQLGKKYRMSATGVSDAAERAKAKRALSPKKDNSIDEQILQALRGLNEFEQLRILQYAIRRKNAQYEG